MNLLVEGDLLIFASSSFGPASWVGAMLLWYSNDAFEVSGVGTKVGYRRFFDKHSTLSQRLGNQSTL